MNKPSATGVTASPELGLIMSRPEVRQIADSFESRRVRRESHHSIDIIPPLKKEQLNKLGQALVELALSLDPNPPKPDFIIHQSSN